MKRATATAVRPEPPRFYSTFEIKAVDEEQRIIEGIASTPQTDRMGDIVDPKGAVYSLPLPFLWQHDKDKPLGHVTSAKVTKDGISITAKIASGILPYIDEAWALIKAKLVRGLSIGFRTLESSDIDGTWGIHFKEWEWLELSAVTIPANSDASIQTIKSIDDRILAASGERGLTVVHLNNPNPAPRETKQTIPKGAHMKTTAERIAEYEAKRAANAGRMQAIMDKSNEDGSTLDDAQAEEYETLTAEIKSIDRHLVRLKDLENVQIARAVGVTAAVGNDPESASNARGGVITVQRNLQKGTSFARYVQALAVSKGNLMQAHEISKRWGDTPEVEVVLKAAMTAGTTTDSDWAEPLVEYQTMASEFVDLLRPETIVGKIQGLRKVPFNIRVAGKTQGSTVGWVGQGAPKPVSELKFNEITLGLAKAAGIVVISQELARSSAPAAEGLIRQDLIDTMSIFMDAQFINPSVAAVANVSPASITNGLTPINATGITVAAVTNDIKSLFGNFINNDIAAKAPVWIMHPTTALGLSLLRTSQDIFAFPDITMNGGTLFGLPVVVSRSVPKTTSGGSIIVLMDASEVFFADDGQVMIDVSEQASLQMDSAPSAGAQALVSLWQNNLVGIRAERYMNWQRRRDSAVTYLDNVPVY